ncbi:MAG: pseudaminic acid cytidylyltransferase [Selenomonadaceae bacterium]|nr:pseudaminic acid cytidylyltransferase [Selenomonadaceae bacterium]
MSKIAIITARGGSKRIPKKNIKEFCGKPIIAYSIEAALKSELFDEVMVSTDDEEIANVARKYGANVPFMRSEKNSDDFATTADVLKEVIAEYKKRGQSFEYMCCIYPTAPFVTAKCLRESFDCMIEKNGNALNPVVRFSYPPQRSMVIENGFLVFRDPKNFRTRSQDLEAWYHDAGQYYFWKLDKFREGVIENTVPYILDDLHVQDIDNLDDWKLAELKYKMLVESEE